MESLKYYGKSLRYHELVDKDSSRTYIVREKCKWTVVEYYNATDKVKYWEDKVIPALIQNRQEYKVVYDAYEVIKGTDLEKAKKILNELIRQIANEYVVFSELDNKRFQDLRLRGVIYG